MKKRLMAVLVVPPVVACLSVPSSALAQSTGRQMYDACYRLILPTPPGPPPSPSESALVGQCRGTIDALAHVGKMLPERSRNCAPTKPEVPTIGVVTEYLRKHRERLDEPFVDLVLAALSERWPCPQQ